ncbi:hypothetical protein [Archangium primigenium]|uniref:hypothetical protein n=1 Tax=[Archangium] primigenium TaxID=2792470 RepID=UPI001959347A|nr:hypothetical protein [Archangium primigenium]MBM7112193.1 hypothetical protein [Archangium primigenium]
MDLHPFHGLTRVCALGAVLLPLVGGAQPSPQNIVLLVDNHESMQNYPVPLPEVFTPGFYPTPVNPAPGEPGGNGPAGHFINTGCTDPALVEAMSWYDKDSLSVRKNGAIPYDADPTLGSRFFEAEKFYHSRGRRLGWQVRESPYALTYDFKTLDAGNNTLNACYQTVGWESVYYFTPVIDECMKCLETKGWWRGPVVSALSTGSMKSPTRAVDEPPLSQEALRKWVVKGGVLNLRPPKFVIARKVLKDLVASATDVRLSVATFGPDHGWYDPPDILSGIALRPTCEAATGGALPVADQDALRTALNNIQYRNNERSTGEALFGLGGYFSSSKRTGPYNTWENWFKQPLHPGFGWPGCCNGGTYDNTQTGQSGQLWGFASDEWVKPPRAVNGVYLPGQPFESADPKLKHYCSPTQGSQVVVITGGRPFYDNTVPITRMMQLLIQQGARHPDGSLLTFNSHDPERNPDVGGVNYCEQFARSKEVCDYTDWNWPTGLGRGNKNFMDDVAFFLANTDLREDLPGVQSLRTSIVNFAGPDEPMLHSMALAGNGVSLHAHTSEQLRAALQVALSSSFRRPGPGIIPSSPPADPADP